MAWRYVFGVSLALAGCTGTLDDFPDEADGGGDVGSDDDAPEVPAGPIPFACPGGAITPGLNTLAVDGAPRTFYADLPTDPTLELGVVFSWHGFGQTADAFRGEAKLDPNANPARPVIVITPNDTDMLPPFGLGWSIVKAEPNIDLALFEAVLGCLRDQYKLDADAIYSFGFSAGAVMTNLVHTVYPDLVRTIVTESGAWFNDPAQAALVSVQLAWEWPALDPGETGTILLTHGGPNDVTVANILSLEEAAKQAVPFLLGAQRVVADCAHDGGHVLDPNVPAPTIINFLTAHPSLPGSCAERLP